MGRRMGVGARPPCRVAQLKPVGGLRDTWGDSQAIRVTHGSAEGDLPAKVL